MKLLNLSEEKFQELIEGMEKNVIMVKKNALKMSWYMRGAVSYTDVLNMSDMERDLLNELIDENIKITKDSGLNHF